MSGNNKRVREHEIKEPLEFARIERMPLTSFEQIANQTGSSFLYNCQDDEWMNMQDQISELINCYPGKLKKANLN